MSKVQTRNSSGFGSRVKDLFERVVSGIGGVIVQFYDEVNKKRGKQWEISRLIPNTSAGQKIYSLMVIGPNYPVDLKARVLGATGGGVVGRVYFVEPEDIASFGTPDRWFNMRTVLNKTGVQPQTKIYSAGQYTFTQGRTEADFATTANKAGADSHVLTNSQNQGKGTVPIPVGSNRILDQELLILFEIESYDTQNVTAALEMYEGGLDFNADS